MQTFSSTFKVYISDTDQAGVVYHANYLKWMEAARVEMLENVGCSYKILQDKQIGLAPVHIDISYKAALKFNDIFTVTTSLSKVGSASLTVNAEFNKDQKLICHSTVKLACIDQVKQKAIPIPTELKNVLISA